MNRPPLDVPCTRCHAPAGTPCTTYGLGHVSLDGSPHAARYDASTDKFLEAHGYEPLRGKGKSA